MNTIKNYKTYVVAGFSVTIFMIAALSLRHLLEETHLRDVLAAFKGTSPSAILAAVACTGASYLALTGYDLLALRHISRPQPYGTVALASFAGSAVGNNIGAALLTGGSVRYRIYSAVGLSPTDAVQVTAFCAMTFGMSVTAMLGVTLLAEPGLAGLADGFPLELNRAVGGVLLATVLAYLIWVALAPRTLKLGTWSVRAPSARMTLLQILVGSADIALAAATLYVFLPSGLDVHFLGFMGVFVIASTIGVLSHAPGGVGVFEAVVLWSLPDVDHAAVIGALLAYRATYYLAPLGLAAFLLAWHEFHQQHKAQTVVVRRTRRLVHLIAPQVIGAAVLLGGAILLLSGATPAMSPRVELLRDLVPLPFVEASHFFASVVGFSLLILARGLFRRLDGARHLTLILLLAGAAFSLVKGFDYEEALILGFVAFLLYVSRSAFHRPASMLTQSFSPAWLATIVIIVAASVWLGLFSYKHVEYSDSLWWTFSYRGAASSFLRAAVAVSALGLAFLLFLLLRPAAPRPLPLAASKDEIAAIIAGAQRADANLAVIGDKQLLVADDKSAFLMFQVQGRSWIAMGDPVGPMVAWAPLLWRFRELCDRHNGWPALYQISAACLPFALDMGLALVKLGEEAEVDLAGFSLEGPARRDLRQAVNKVEREGASFEIIPASGVPTILDELQAVSDAWMLDKSAYEKGFSAGRFTPDYVSHFDCAAVRSAGRIVAFANIWRAPAASVISIDLMRYSKDAPKGVMDYLFAKIMLWGRAIGYRRFNLGMAPLSGLQSHPLGPAWNRLGALVFAHGEPYYNFEGLRSYKQKFHPHWEPRYLAAPGGLAFPRILVDITALIAGGYRNIFSK